MKALIRDDEVYLEIHWDNFAKHNLDWLCKPIKDGGQGYTLVDPYIEPTEEPEPETPVEPVSTETDFVDVTYE